MKNSEKILPALLIGGAAIALIVWFIVGGREPEIDPMLQTETAVSAEAGVSGGLYRASGENPLAIVSAVVADSGDAKKETSDATASGNAASAPVAGKTARHDVSGNSFYKSNAVVTYGKASAQKPQNAEAVLEEMRGFWDSIGLEALKDLWVLDRYQELTVWLSEHTDVPYFYSGEKNAGGEPEGRGIAVYSGNRYYYGEWKNGLREGAGDWYQFYPERMQDVVVLHEYTGNWRGDLPNGDGVDVYEYDLSRMEGDVYYPMNYIGNFTDGLCDGEMLVTIQEPGGRISAWCGTCKKGVWQPVEGHPDADGKIQAVYERENPENRISMWPEYNKGYGVYHVK